MGVDLTAIGEEGRDFTGEGGRVSERGTPTMGIEEGRPLQKQRENVKEGLTQSVDGLCLNSQS